MKKLCDSYRSLYDKVSLNVISSDWKIQEDDSKATFQELIISGLSGYSIPKAVYKNTHEPIFKNSSALKDLDCDGFAFVSHEGTKYIVAVELKSNFDTAKILRASHQMCWSFLKNHMVMSICNGYDIDNYEIVFVIACHCPTSQAKDRLLLETTSSKLCSKDIWYAVKLLAERCLEQTFGRTSLFNDKELSDVLKDKKVRIVLVTTDCCNDTQKTISFSDLL